MFPHLPDAMLGAIYEALGKEIYQREKKKGEERAAAMKIKKILDDSAAFSRRQRGFQVVTGGRAEL